MNIFKLIWPELPNHEDVWFDIARSEHAEPIGLLSKELVETGMSGWSWHPDRVLGQINSEASLVIIGRSTNDIIASAIVEFGQYSARLNLLVVKRGYQGKGIGRSLVGFVEKVAALRDLAAVTLEVRKDNTFARDFYLGLGYREIGTVPGYYSDNHPAIRMARHPDIPEEKPSYP